MSCLCILLSCKWFKSLSLCDDRKMFKNHCCHFRFGNFGRECLSVDFMTNDELWKFMVVMVGWCGIMTTINRCRLFGCQTIGIICVIVFGHVRYSSRSFWWNLFWLSRSSCDDMLAVAQFKSTIITIICYQCNYCRLFKWIQQTINDSLK